MVERLLDPDAREVRAAAEGPTRGGEDQPLDRSRPLGADQLEERRVLGVDRQESRPGRLGQSRRQLAADHQALLVGERQVDARAERGDRRAQPGGADHPVEDEIRLGCGDQLAHAVLAGQHATVPGGARLVRRLLVGQRDGRDSVLPRLLDDRLPARPGRQPGDLELIGAGDDLQRLHADRAAATEDHNLTHEQSVGSKVFPTRIWRRPKAGAMGGIGSKTQPPTGPDHGLIPLGAGWGPADHAQ